MTLEIEEEKKKKGHPGVLCESASSQGNGKHTWNFKQEFSKENWLPSIAGHVKGNVLETQVGNSRQELQTCALPLYRSQTPAGAPPPPAAGYQRPPEE